MEALLRQKRRKFLLFRSVLVCYNKRRGLLPGGGPFRFLSALRKFESKESGESYS